MTDGPLRGARDAIEGEAPVCPQEGDGRPVGHPIPEPGADARRDLLAAALALGAHLDAHESEVNDEMLVRPLCAFMDARACCWLTSAHFQLALTSGVSANSVCFERELLGHYARVVEKDG
jgi:hypothetical protein